MIHTDGLIATIAMGLAAVRLRTVYVQPIAWKRALKLSRDKELSRLRASQLYPEDAEQWRLKGDDGKAEACLIAHYGRSMMVQGKGLVAA